MTFEKVKEQFWKQLKKEKVVLGARLMEDLEWTLDTVD